MKVTPPALKPPVRRFIRIVSAAISVRNAVSLRISAVLNKDVKRGRLPLLVHSRVGFLDINYWRKTIIVGPLKDGKVAIRLRIPTRSLKQPGQYTIRIRVVHPTSVSTSFVQFKSVHGQGGEGAPASPATPS